VGKGIVVVPARAPPHLPIAVPVAVPAKELAGMFSSPAFKDLFGNMLSILATSFTIFQTAAGAGTGTESIPAAAGPAKAA